MQPTPKHAHSIRLMIRDDVLQYFKAKSEKEDETLSLLINKALLQIMREQEALESL